MKRILLTLLLFSSQLVFSQIIVTGIVKDSNTGENLPFANVSLKGSRIGTPTNLDGHFTLLNVPTDTSTLLISYVGYAIKELKLSPATLVDKITIKLESISASLQEVIISDSGNKFLNTATGVSHATISTKQLSLLPSIGEVDIFRSLQLLPGISGTNESASGLYVRGGTPDQNLVLLDGITVYKVDHFFGFFSAFNANAIKDVQLYKGGFPAKYGERISSVVDLTGKTGSFEEIHAEAGLNFISGNALIEIPITKNFSVLFAGRRSYTDIIQSNVFKSVTANLSGGDPFPAVSNLNNTSVNTVDPIFYFFDWNSKFSYKPNDNDLFTVSMYQGQDFLDESRSFVRTIDRQAADPIQVTGNIIEKTNWGNTGLSTKWSRQWSPKFYSNFLVSTSTYFSKYNRKGFLEIGIPAQDSTIFEAQQFTDEDNKVRDFSARLDAEWLLSAKHKLELGASLTQSDINYKNIRNDTLIVLDRAQNANYSSIYFSDTWQPSPKISLTAGVRASYYQMTEAYLYSPRLSATYNLTNQIKIKAATGKYYQFVNQITNENISEGSRDFWLLADGEQVKVSSAIHYILGTSYENRGWLFDLEGYYKDLNNLSEFSLRYRSGGEIDLNQLFFIGSGVAKGVELLIQKKQGNYTGWVSYTLGRVTYNFPDLNIGQDFPALHDQRHEFKVVSNYQVDQWSFAATFVYGSGKPFSEPEGKYTVTLLDGKESSYISIGPKNGTRLPAYHRLDISIHHFFPIGKKVKGDLGISVFNVYNKTNIWYREYDFSQQPVLITNVNYLGMLPNLSINIKF